MPWFASGLIVGVCAAPFVIFFAARGLAAALRIRRRAAARLEVRPAPRPLCALEPPPVRGRHLQLVVGQAPPRERQ